MLPMPRVGLDTGELTDEELRYIYSEIIGAAWPALKARDIFEIETVPSVGFREIRKFTETDMSAALIDMDGDEVNIDRTQLAASTISMPVIHKEFIVNWRDLEARREVGQSLDLVNARNAGRQVSEEENKLLFSGEHTGWRSLGILGLVGSVPAGNDDASAGAWPANAAADINVAIGRLETDGFDPPYVMCLPVALARKLDVAVGAGGAGMTYRKFFLQNDVLQGIITDDSVIASDGGVDSAIIVCPGKENFSLQVARDITVRTVILPNMNLFGRVYEVVTPMIKRPNSLAEINTIT